jgi:hypothetical protein
MIWGTIQKARACNSLRWMCTGQDIHAGRHYVNGTTYIVINILVCV